MHERISVDEAINKISVLKEQAFKETRIAMGNNWIRSNGLYYAYDKCLDIVMKLK